MVRMPACQRNDSPAARCLGLGGVSKGGGSGSVAMRACRSSRRSCRFASSALAVSSSTCAAMMTPAGAAVTSVGAESALIMCFQHNGVPDVWCIDFFIISSHACLQHLAFFPNSLHLPPLAWLLSLIQQPWRLHMKQRQASLQPFQLMGPLFLGIHIKLIVKRGHAYGHRWACIGGDTKAHLHHRCSCHARRCCTQVR